MSAGAQSPGAVPPGPPETHDTPPCPVPTAPRPPPQWPRPSVQSGKLCPPWKVSGTERPNAAAHRPWHCISSTGGSGPPLPLLCFLEGPLCPPSTPEASGSRHFPQNSAFSKQVHPNKSYKFPPVFDLVLELFKSNIHYLNLCQKASRPAAYSSGKIPFDWYSVRRAEYCSGVAVRAVFNAP